MTAVNRPLYIEQGATFAFGFNWYHAGVPAEDGTPTPGAPYEPTEVRMQIRRRLGEPALLSASSEGVDPRFTLGEDGRIDLLLTDADTMLLTQTSAVYDLEAVLPDGSVHRLLQGAVTVDMNVTTDEP